MLNFITLNPVPADILLRASLLLKMFPYRSSILPSKFLPGPTSIMLKFITLNPISADTFLALHCSLRCFLIAVAFFVPDSF
jgi:hypothetical protein